MYTLVAHARGRGIFGSFKIKTELAAQGVMAGTNRIRPLRSKLASAVNTKRSLESPLSLNF